MEAVYGEWPGLEDDALVVSANAGRLAIAKLSIGDGKKLAAIESGISLGSRLD